MQYLSPSAILGNELSWPLDKKAIQLSRKKLLAELELAGGESVDLHGTAFTKNDIITWFEELGKDNIAVYHEAVAEDPVLQDFLEKGSIGPLHLFHINPLYKDPSFLRWISPYFYSAFTPLANTALRQGEDQGLSDVLNNPLLMTIPDLEKAWAYIAGILTNNIGLLQYYAQQQSPRGQHKMSSGEVSHLMDFSYINLLCQLPEDRFSELRNQHAAMMMEAGIHTFNRHANQRSAVDTWMQNAEALASSPELRRQIADKREEMNKLRKKKRNSILLRFVIPGIVVLMNLARYNSGDNDPVPVKQLPTYFTVPGDTTKHLFNHPSLDSVLRSGKAVQFKS